MSGRLDAKVALITCGARASTHKSPRAAVDMLRCMVAVAPLVLAASASAQVVGPQLPGNDLESAVSLASGQDMSGGRAVTIAHPPLVPVPRATCGQGSEPLDDPIQGRVSQQDVDSPQAAKGWTCNLTAVAGFPTPGGFRVWRYVDRNHHVCAFYDSSLNAPANIVSLAAAPTQGVIVLDMSDPAHPVQTADLTTPGMLSPHESLNLSVARGLLGAETGTGLTSQGTFDVYDVSSDCRHPLVDSITPIKFGHESGFSPDGRTFWVSGGVGQIAAFDVTNPKVPYIVWTGDSFAHGLSLSADGRTLYLTDPINGNLAIVDVSQVQARAPDPHVRLISRSTWDTVSIPQNSIPITIKGHPYLIEFDEFAFRFNPATVDDRVGAARIIDIADAAHPTIVSDLRLHVNMRAVHQQVDSDPYPLGVKTNGYGAHYCSVPTQTDPAIVACSFLNSGLRIFDIRDPAQPRETGYFVSPPKKGGAPGQAGDMAFSQPAFDVARHDVWYSDATSGFYVLHVNGAAWPRLAATTACVSRRRVLIHLPRAMQTASVRYLARRAPTARRAGRLIARIDMRGLGAQTIVVRITGRTRSGRVVRQTRRFKTCRGRLSGSSRRALRGERPHVMAWSPSD